MDSETFIVLGAFTVALLTLATLPPGIAWIVAWRSKMDRSIRRSFLITCLMLSHGQVALTAVVPLPIRLAAVYAASPMRWDGYEKIATAIEVTSQWFPVVCLIAGLAASVLFPLSLRGWWQVISVGLRANNSFKPNSLRESA